jgi:hypothetical protein
MKILPFEVERSVAGSAPHIGFRLSLGRAIRAGADALVPLASPFNRGSFGEAGWSRCVSRE